MKKFTTAMLVLAAGAAVANAASYTVIDWDPSVGHTPVIGGQTALSYSSDFTVPKFNPGLGTLTKVSWYIYAEFTGEVDLTNNGGLPQNGLVNFGTQHTTAANATLGVFEVTSPLAAGGPFAYALNPGDSTTIGPDAGNDDDSGFTVNGAQLNNWTGAGTVNIPLLHESVLNLIGGGSLTAEFTQTGRSRIEVTYEYTDAVIPEPGTYVGGLALLGVGGLAYRRMRRA